MKIIKRQIAKELKSLSRQYPVVVITGPRQSGKTTLAKMCFPRLAYSTLEDPDTREVVLSDPRAFLKSLTNGAIIDEIQHAPKVLSYLQSAIDNHDIKGKIILTGSSQFEVMKNVSQSLAGRAAILKLLPFSILETQSFKSEPIPDLIVKGFYPRIYSEKQEPFKSYRNYFETYIQRDVRQFVNLKDTSLFRKFVKLCAGRIGQIFVASSIANDVGVSVTTVLSWISILEASFIVFMLESYYENIGKRLIKSPKIYFYDTGLAAYLLGIEQVEQLSRDPLRGGLFENLAIIELLKKRFNAGLDHNLYFYRDSNGNEVDVLYKKANAFKAFEIKSAETYSGDFSKGINVLQKVLKNRLESAYVVYAGKTEKEFNNIKLINIKNIAQSI